MTGVQLERVAPEWVVIGCSGQRFSVPLDRVREIVPPQPVTRLPGCGPEVYGLIGFRGRIYTALDLGAALGLEPSIRAEEHRLLMLEYRSELLAGAVDEVVDITHEATGELDLDAILDRFLA